MPTPPASRNGWRPTAGDEPQHVPRFICANEVCRGRDVDDQRGKSACRERVQLCKLQHESCVDACMVLHVHCVCCTLRRRECQVHRHVPNEKESNPPWLNGCKQRHRHIPTPVASHPLYPCYTNGASVRHGMPNARTDCAWLNTQRTSHDKFTHRRHGDARSVGQRNRLSHGSDVNFERRAGGCHGAQGKEEGRARHDGSLKVGIRSMVERLKLETKHTAAAGPGTTD